MENSPFAKFTILLIYFGIKDANLDFTNALCILRAAALHGMLVYFSSSLKGNHFFFFIFKNLYGSSNFNYQFI